MTSTFSRFRLASQAERTYSGSPRTPRNSPFGPRTLPNLVARKTSSRRSAIAADQLLILPPAVHVGGVEEVHPPIERVMDGRDRLRLVPADVKFTHPHAAKADGRHFGTVAAEPPFSDL